MAYNISLNNITTTTAPVQQELSGISLQTSASALPRVDIQPNVNEHQLPQALSPSDSCLENEESSSQQPEVKKEQAEKKKKVHKKSNKYSNHTKAKGHLAAIAGATTLGAVLAPFTGGLSLLPTAFVVLFGNASALAMYGGSEFVLGQKGPNNQIDDKKDPEANKQPEENKQPEISVPVSPRPIRAQEFRGLDEVNGRREPEPEEKGSRGKGDTFNYSPVFNFNFGDLNFNQFNTQNNTQFNTQNNTDKTNQADTDSSPTLIEQTIEKFGGNPVINVEEITKDVLIRELREQEPLIGPESKVDEMIDALVSFHEQTNEAKLIQVSFESGHKAYIGGIPDTDEQKQTDPIKAEVCVEKAKKQWPEVKPAHRLITTSGNAKIDGNPGYRNARVDVDGQTVGYTRNERGGSQPQSSGVHTSQGSQQPGVEPSPVDPGHGASGAASVQPGGEAKGAQTPSLQTEGESISTSMPTGEEQGVQTGGVKKWPEVAAPQRVITSAGNAKIDGNPGYRNARVDVDGQTVGYTRNERGGSQPQSSGVHTSQGSQQPGVEPSPVDPGHGASGAASVQPGGEAKGAQTPSLHTQGEPISTATQTGGAQNIQSVTLARADLQQTNVERGRITDVTKLVDVKALASTVAANKSEPERFVSKLHITLKGNSSADSKVGTNQPESLQAWSSNMLSPGPGVKLAQKSLVQNEIELMPQANKGETVKKIEVVSNISGKKWTVSMPAPVLTTQGMASGRGKNYTQGLFHNIRDINQTKRNIELNSTLMESTPKSDVSFVNMGDKVFPIKPAIISNLKLVS
ncbi:hypothetical protein FDE04_09240 [Vibrio parahaemolyticus]|uniref:hypothetical protein n=1 Tax=Vibrio parahaemolyticus TaxID=670 RepID=UPI00128F81C4|nr:hypothetical protein [Vibrio parahaemolyticus]MBO1654991.1 hypothetical protein [Vibrio parahaemolyticus]MQF50956.1 hypothetical protein [Vibrio parahaemolyticus]